MRFHHYGLEVSNMEESIDFYKKGLGLEVESRMFFMDEEIVFLASPDFRLELIFGTQEAGVSRHICFEVRDLDSVMSRFSGYEVAEGPYKLQNGWQTVFYKGPEGEVIEFLQVNPM
ncbi:VOC family protein [Neobacillus mesonae]|uniref:VOC family protein n=1 Tax=Neobacillus mesonae TaxID=1193713 RepID=UPI0025743CA9|nr:VOC family protein [Neobacillus mesonae]